MPRTLYKTPLFPRENGRRRGRGVGEGSRSSDSRRGRRIGHAGPAPAGTRVRHPARAARARRRPPLRAPAGPSGELGPKVGASTAEPPRRGPKVSARGSLPPPPRQWWLCSSGTSLNNVPTPLPYRPKNCQPGSARKTPPSWCTAPSTRRSRRLGFTDRSGTPSWRRKPLPRPGGRLPLRCPGPLLPPIVQSEL